MGSYCSVHNDTSDETVMVYIGANTKVLKPILWTMTGLATAVSSSATLGFLSPTYYYMTMVAGSTIVLNVNTVAATAVGGAVSITNYVLDKVQNQVVADLSKGGYSKLIPGQSYTCPKKTLSLNLRAWVIRVQKTSNAILIKRSNASIWTGPIPGSNITYNVTDSTYFSKWRTETIPIHTREQQFEEEAPEVEMITRSKTTIQTLTSTIRQHHPQNHDPTSNIKGTNSHDNNDEDSDYYILNHTTTSVNTSNHDNNDEETDYCVLNATNTQIECLPFTNQK